jgi:hypothetical protein
MPMTKPERHRHQAGQQEAQPTRPSECASWIAMPLSFGPLS